MNTEQPVFHPESGTGLGSVKADLPYCAGHPTAGHPPGTAVDPVCGMRVEVATAQHTLRLGEHTNYFCNRNCLDKFRADPERYLHVPASPTTEGASIDL